MEKEKAGKLIEDFHFDINNLHEDWDEGKIDNKTALEKITNLCFYYLRTLADNAIKKGGKK